MYHMNRISRTARSILDDLLVRAGLAVRAFWWRPHHHTNFGDELTPFILGRLTGRRIIRCDPTCTDQYFAAVGSILGSVNANAIVWGSGIISRHQRIERPRRVTGVRGPYSRQRLLQLGIECPEVYGDPALLLPFLYTPAVQEYRSNLGVVPHYKEYDIVRPLASPLVKVVDMRQPVTQVIDDISNCDTVVSSSLHGLVVAHAYKIPVLPVYISDRLHGDGIKYLDYLETVGLTSLPTRLSLEDLSRPQEIADHICLHAPSPRFDLESLVRAAPFPMPKATRGRLLRWCHGQQS